MTSALLDVAVCLLLVSAAVVTVGVARDAAAPSEHPSAGHAAPVVDHRANLPGGTLSVLTTATVTVSHPFAGSGSRGSTDRAGQSRTRRDDRPVNSDDDGTIHDEGRVVREGTPARLLARAAIRAARVDGRRLFPAGGVVVRRVRAAVSPLLGAFTQVTATWRPYHGSHVEGSVTVGSTPPADAAVRAASTTVPVPGVGSTPGSARSPPESPDAPDAAHSPGRSTSNAAARVARRLVRRFVSPTVVTRAVATGSPVADTVARRYSRLADVYGATVDSNRTSGRDPTDPSTASRRLADVRAANADLASHVATRVRADLRRRAVSVTAPRRRTLDRVRLTVRWWSE
ncbi:hypothetical protein RYH80_04775 [Halobaculum sp. MBLA0147]|uniref:DUF7284 family protein n=1 Tax=Halobaculum sp. MBLA0147 TaxID=3079934 RepID=UPI003524578E